MFAAFVRNPLAPSIHHEGAEESDPKEMRANPHATAGFPQVYIVDPDGHVIEISASALAP